MADIVQRADVGMAQRRDRSRIGFLALDLLGPALWMGAAGFRPAEEIGNIFSDKRLVIYARQ